MYDLAHIDLILTNITLYKINRPPLALKYGLSDNKFMPQYLKIILPLTAMLLFACSNEPVYPEAPFNGNNVSINTATLEDDMPVFYTYKHENRNLNFFVVKTDNKVLSYFDACAKCYHSKKGYRFVNGRFICNHCGHSRSFFTIDKNIGGCYPLPLNGQLNGEIYDISENSIIKGSIYF